MKASNTENTGALHHRLEMELVRTEKTRVIIFMLVVGIAFTGSILDSLFIRDQVSRLFYDMSVFYRAILVGQLIFVELVIALIHVNRCMKHNKPLSLSYKVFTILFESAFPGILLLILLQKMQTGVLVDSPVIFIYIPILIVSILHLDYRLTFLSGLTITVIYGVALNMAMTINEVSEIRLILPEAAYYIRLVMLLVATICAAYVANRLRKRMESGLRYQDQRNTMQQLFSQQVSKEVVDALVANPDKSKKRHVSILFLDIRGFTDFTQDKTPEEVIDFQNRFFSPVIDIINKHKGITNQLMGDGLMATFGAPIKLKNHESVAYLAAREIYDHVDEHDEVKIGIGIHNGEVVTGNIGNENRKQYSISGKTVIVAARLEQMNKEYQSNLLVSKNYFDEISSQVQDWTNLGKHKLKGIDKEIEIIKLL